MATSKGKKTAPVIAVVTLASIVAATQADSFVYTSEAVHKPLIEQGFVELNPAIVNEAGEIATRATQKGIDSTMTAKQETEIATPVAKTSNFALEVGVAMPAISGRGRTGGSAYPFEQMEVGNSFFVANTEDKPNAAKSLASTVSSATARYATVDPSGATKANKKGEQVPVMIENRKFVVRSVEGGARVWRTA